MSLRRLGIAAVILSLGLVVVPAGMGQEEREGTRAPEIGDPMDFVLPRRAPIRYEDDGGLELRRMLSRCCLVTERLDRRLPSPGKDIPEKIGSDRRYFVVKLREEKIVVAVETLKDFGTDEAELNPLLLRADTNRNGDLGDDPVIRCGWMRPCGPFETRLPTPRGEMPYAFLIELRSWDRFTGESVKVGPARAWMGELAGVRFAVIDDDFDGSHDGAGDLLVVDVDGDGELEGGWKGREAFPRWRILPMGEHYPWKRTAVRLAGVDPLTGSAIFEEAPMAWLLAELVDVQSGGAVRGAEVTVSPGGFSARSGADGKVRMRIPQGPIDWLTVQAPGYYGTVVGPGQEGRMELGKENQAGFRILLRRGPCDYEVHQWCGVARLRASSLTRSSVDLDSGRFESAKGGARADVADVGWYVPPEGLVLSFQDEARGVLVDDSDFEDVSLQTLRELDARPGGIDQKSFRAKKWCGRQGRRDGVVRPGTVIGFRTREGRLGKLEIEKCLGHRLELRWIVYEDSLDATSTPLEEAAAQEIRRPGNEAGEEAKRAKREVAEAGEMTTKAAEVVAEKGQDVGSGLRVPLRVADHEALRRAGWDLAEADVACCSSIGPFDENPAGASTVPAGADLSKLRFGKIRLRGVEILFALEGDVLGREPAANETPSRLWVDTDQDRDLADEESLDCKRREPCGPLPVLLDLGAETMAYPALFRLGTLTFSKGARRGEEEVLVTRELLKYGPGSALVGELGGVKIAVVDSYFDGVFDDPEDLLLVDLDRNGRFDAHLAGVEIRSIHQPLPAVSHMPWGESRLRVEKVDLAAREIVFRPAEIGELSVQVTSLNDGERVEGARVDTYPGLTSGVTDSRGKVRLLRPLGPLDFFTVRADGYSSVSLEVGSSATQQGEIEAEALLEPGPCRYRGVRWCDSIDLIPSDLRPPSLDLDWGLTGRSFRGWSLRRIDVVWRSKVGERALEWVGGARATILESENYDSVSAEDLRRVSVEDRRIPATYECGGSPARNQRSFREGTVLAIVTSEGYLGKVLVENCAGYLALRWTVFDQRYEAPDSGDS